jgi:excisionase family DNA binding protein
MIANPNQQERPAGFAAAFEPFITKAEVARRLGKRMRTIDNWMQRGLLPYYKIGRSVAFKWGEVEQHLRQICRVCRAGEE